jgi:translocation and assembly module TamB
MKPLGAKRWRPHWKILLLVVFAAGLVSLAGLAWYMTTDSFQAMVRRRFVAEVEHVTGGRVELGSIHSIPLRFEVEVRNLTIHGREQPGDLPYAHVDRLLAQIKLRSALGGELKFRSIVLERPIVHLMVASDGNTNQPTPRRQSLSVGSQLERLFRFSVNRLEVRQGELVWNDRTIPLDFLTQDLSATMEYSLLRRKYDGKLAIGKMETRFEDYPPAAWTAEVHFELGHNYLLIDSLKASSNRSQVEVSGRLVNFRQPEISAQYGLRLDLAEVAALARLPEIRQGRLELRGRGTWSGTVFSADGKWDLADVEGGGENCRRLRASSFDGQFALSPQRLELRDIEGRLLGGEVAGDAQVFNWQDSFAPSSRSKSDPERGSVRLHLRNLSLEAIAAACSSSARPFERMQLVGYASGSVDTRWRSTPRNAEAEIALDVVPPTQVLPARLPLRAHVHASYRVSAGELEVSEFNAETLESQARAAGTLSTRAALKVSVMTTNLDEWQRGLAALGYREPLPFAFRGRATFTGTATGRLSEIDFRGRLQAQDFQVERRANTLNPQRKSRWDLLSTNLELSPHAFSAHHGTLERGTTLLRFDLSVGLDKRMFTEQSPFAASVEIEHAEAEEMLALAGYSYAVTGRLDLSLRASGTHASPGGQGWFRLTDATLAGATVKSAQSSFTLRERQLSLDEIHLACEPGQVQGKGSYDLASHALELNLNGSNFDLAHLPWLGASPRGVAGRVDFKAQASGTLEQPNMNSQIHLRDLAFGKQPLGDYTLEAASLGADLRIRGHSDFQVGQLDVDGDIHLREDWPAKINFEFNHLAVDPILAAYLPSAVTRHVALTGDLEMRGPLRNPSQLELTGNIGDALATLGPIPLHNNGPIRFAISGRVLKVQRFRLTGDGTDLDLEGSVAFGQPSPLDLHAGGHADLALLRAVNPAFHSSGGVTLDVNARGSLEQPLIEGRVGISQGQIQYGDLPSALSELNGSLVLHEDRLQIESLTGQAGGGSIRFGGYATWYKRQLNFDVALNAEDVRLRYPPGVSSMTTANLRWTGTPAGSTLSGDATVTKLAVIPGFDFGSYLLHTAQASALPQTNPLLSGIRMNVHIVTTPDLEMRTAALNLLGNADLDLRGTAAKPVLLGRADILEGQVVFNGTRYRMERGDITFTNPVTTTPVLDLQASTQVREYDILLNLNGPFDKLNLSYHSEPPLPTADIISLLAPVGTTQQQFGQVQQQTGSSPFVQQASSQVLAEAVNSALSNRSQHLFGISHIKIDPQGLNQETTPTQTSPLPAVTIEQQVKNNVTLTYTTNVAQTSQQIIQAEYNFTHNISVVGIRDYNGVVSFEVRARQSKR